MIKEFIKMPLHIKLRRVRIKLYHFFCKKKWGGIGKGSIVEKPMFIMGKKNIYIGCNVQIRDGARIEAISEYGEQKLNPVIRIGDNTSIEQRLHMTCANQITIGHDVTISADVLITDNSHGIQNINQNVRLQPLKVGITEIGDYSFIGAGCKTLAGANIGKNSIVGANSVVTCDVPNYCMVAGVPAKILKTFDFGLNKWVECKDNKRSI